MFNAGFGNRALAFLLVFLAASAQAQEQSRSAGQQPAAPAQQAAAAAAAEPEAPRVVLQAETTASVLRLMKFSGLLRDRAGNLRTGAVGLTFALYKDQQGGSPLWLEVHNAQLDEQGRYTVLLGSTKSDGLPLEVFSSGEARWLGVQVNLPGEEEQPRVLLVSVPYALKAADAETLGGKPPSAFLLAEKAEGREAAETKPEAGKEAVKEGPRREGVVGPINGEGSLNMVAKFTGANAIGNGTIFDNGFVGIGTTSPSARLHIFEPEPSQNANVRLMGSGQTGSWMDIFAGTAVGFGLFGYGAQPFLFGVGAVERMRITPTGEVGLGTTSPNAKLSVGSGSIADASVPVQISTGTSGTVSYYGANKNGGYGLLLGYENGGSLGTGGVLRMVPADPLLFFVNNSTEAMRITSAGNVGIGTANPTSILSLGGEAARTFGMERRTVASQFGNPLTVRAGGATFGATDKAGGLLILSGGISTGNIGSEIQFHTATPGASGTADNFPTPKMWIDSNGNVLLNGDTSKFFAMAQPIVPDTAGNSLTVRAGGATTPATNKSGGNLILDGGISTGTGGSEIHLRTATPGASGTASNLPSTKMTISGNGNVGIGTTAPSSDLSLGGEATRTFGMERRTVAEAAGNFLQVQAGGATVGATNRSGGSLILSGGISTGNQGSVILLQTASPGPSGTFTNPPTTKMTIDGNGNVGISGNLSVGGTVSKGGGSFRIDHPLDPANKYLSHSFVESPDMMNVYNGNVRLDANGEAWVELPEWLEALNRDFRYQLTALGAPGPNLYIGEKISGNRFKIAGGRPGGEVSWQVTGIRKDAYANAYRIKVEEEKPLAQRGSYLHPELFGPPKEKSAETVHHPRKVTAAEK